ncbi:hypothetical protein QYF36_008781 [Acer negundo]|nr:hypothetical protein QYF36_008781 [Acer negundo]
MPEEDRHSATTSQAESAARNDRRSGKVFWCGERPGVGDSSGIDDGAAIGSTAANSVVIDAAVKLDRLDDWRWTPGKLLDRATADDGSRRQWWPVATVIVIGRSRFPLTVAE